MHANYVLFEAVSRCEPQQFKLHAGEICTRFARLFSCVRLWRKAFQQLAPKVRMRWSNDQWKHQPNKVALHTRI
jgi:hypothetical protein